MSGMQELDGMGLHDRADWPLPSPSPPQAPVSHDNKHLGHHIMAELEQELGEEPSFQRGSLAGPPASTAMSLYAPQEQVYDVSDIEEEDEEEAEEEEEEEEEVDDDDDTDDNIWSHRASQTEGSESRSSVSYSRSSLARTVYSKQADVSPVREEHDSVIKVSPDTTAKDGAVRPKQYEQYNDSLKSYSEATESDEDDDDDDDDYEEDEDENEDEEVEQEARDVARPLSFATGSPAPLQGSNPNVSPQLNGDTSSSPYNTPDPNQIGFEPRNYNRSSIAKEPMHSGGNRRSSARNSFLGTAQIPNQKDRVRWSWQSAQDDEPNRPRIHVIKLFSQTVTSSAAFPTGEALSFSMSPGGRRIAAYNSSRLYVLQTNALPMGISQEYSVKRRPLDVQLTDEPNLMAVLADCHTVNIYELGHQLRRTKTIKLDFPTHCIALAPTGGLLAAAYEGGTEVFSLDPTATDTDRRAVRSVKMDRLIFSDDGSTLLGTTTRINAASVMVCSVPVFPETPDGLPTHEDLRKAWCSDLLHPENIRNSSHAVFMRENRKTTNERFFAWNGLEDTFGILNATDLQYGNIDFPVVISPPLSTCGGLGAAVHSCPSIDEHGETVAMIVNDRTVRLYIIPSSTGNAAGPTEAHSIDHELDEGYGCPFSEVRWVHSSASLPAPSSAGRVHVTGRLIVTSPGGVNDPSISEEGVEDIEDGRLIVFDFDPQFAGQPGQTFSLTLGKSPPTPLEEEQLDVTEQVNLVRRRTVNQSKSAALNQRPPTLGRSATTRTRSQRGDVSGHRGNAGPNRNRNSMLSIASMQSEAANSLPDLGGTNEVVGEDPEEPYVQGAPRSHASLQRAASNAQRYRYQTLEERTQERVSVDASGGFLALPEYTEEPNAPLPRRFRAMAGLDAPTPFDRPRPSVVTNINGNLQAPSPLAAGPHTAPPEIGVGFNADAAYETASANPALSPQQQYVQHPKRVDSISMTSPTSAVSIPSSVPSSLQVQPFKHGPNYEISPPCRPILARINTHNPAINGPQTMGPFDHRTVAAMPRSLQRAYSNAYSNAVSPVSALLPPSRLGGDWYNVSPIVPTRSATMPLQTSMTGEEAISPFNASSVSGILDRPSPASPYSASQYSGSQYSVSQYRYSTSLLDPPGHMPPRRQTSHGSVATSPAGPVSSRQSSRRLPPHMEHFRNAAAAAATASSSLFPAVQPRDQIPLRQNTVRAGTVAHPITAWHPPAPSAPRANHARKGSGGKGAFASTEKAKKLGFFKKPRKADGMEEEEVMMGGGAGGEEDADGQKCRVM